MHVSSEEADAAMLVYLLSNFFTKFNYTYKIWKVLYETRIVRNKCPEMAWCLNYTQFVKEKEDMRREGVWLVSTSSLLITVIPK